MLPLLLAFACGGNEDASDAVDPASAVPAPSSPGFALPADQVPPGDGPVIAVVVPLSGPNAALGAAALAGARLAVPPGLEVMGIDEAPADPVPRVLSNPRIVGVVAHVSATGAERWAGGWVGQDIPVVLAAPSSVAGLPRVLAGGDRHLQCATAWTEGRSVLVVHDGTAESIANGSAADRALGRASMGMRAIDPSQTATEAGLLKGRHARVLMFTGEAANGGNLLRALRQIDEKADFIGLGLYDPRFLDAAGKAGEGALVTSQDRPALDLELLERWRTAEGGDPPTVAMNAHDAARLLAEAWSTATPSGKEAQRAAVRARLREVEVEGAAGPLHLDADGVAAPAWCTAFRVRDGALVFDSVARLVDGRPERVDLVLERARLAQARAEALEAQEALAVDPG